VPADSGLILVYFCVLINSLVSRRLCGDTRIYTPNLANQGRNAERFGNNFKPHFKPHSEPRFINAFFIFQDISQPRRGGKMEGFRVLCNTTLFCFHPSL
jgi:hypothetical protein